MDSIIIALVGGMVTVMLAIVALFAKALLNRLGDTHDLVNSRMTELLELTRKSSRAEGMKDEKESRE